MMPAGIESWPVPVLQHFCARIRIALRAGLRSASEHRYQNRRAFSGVQHALYSFNVSSRFQDDSSNFQKVHQTRRYPRQCDRTHRFLGAFRHDISMNPSERAVAVELPLPGELRGTCSNRKARRNSAVSISFLKFRPLRGPAESRRPPSPGWSL
jgi:hypothetical protein